MEFHFKRLLSIAVLVLLFAARAFCAPPVNWTIKGMNYVSWWMTEYGVLASEQSLDRLTADAVSCVALVETRYMTNGTSTSFVSNSQSHPNADLVKAVRDIHHRGMKVMLKPHIDRLDGQFRGVIAPSTPGRWFTNYRRFMTNMARICQNENVELFCVNTELDSMAEPAAYTNYWKMVINAIKAIYPGPLVTTGNWGRAGLDLQCYLYSRVVKFVDYAGVDAYFPLDNATTPLIPTLNLDWRNSQATGTVGFNWVSEISNWQAGHGKPVLFGEIGYASRNACAKDPWASGGTYNATAQSNSLEAAFEVWQNHSWFAGAFVWTWYPDPNAGGAGDASLTVQNKPAEKAVARWYRTSAVIVSNCSATPFYATNNIGRVVQFSCRVRGAAGAVTNVSISLENLGGPLKTKMTNLGGGLWRYAFTVPAGIPQDDEEVFFTGLDNAGGSGFGLCSLIVVNPNWQTRPEWMIYDAGDTSVDTDTNIEWSWGSGSFIETTNQPRWGAKAGRFQVAAIPYGAANLRDPSWTGIDADASDRLEFWLRARGPKRSASEGLRARLFSVGNKYSSPVDISLTSNFRRFDIACAALTNKTLGADAGFSMKTLLGLELANGTGTAAGTVVDLDNVLLSSRIMVLSAVVFPAVTDNTKATNIVFTVLIRDVVANITSVTLNLTALGAGKVTMANISGATLWRATWPMVQGFAAGTYLCPIIPVDSLGNRSKAECSLTVIGPTPRVIEALYDGETPASDAAWECWWGCTNRGVDVLAGVMNGLKSLQVTWPMMGGGVQIPTAAWWNGVDVSMADSFQFYYKSSQPLTMRLFSYDPVLGTRNSKDLVLPSSGGAWRQVKTNLSYLTNGAFSLKKIVGVNIDAAAATTAWFDDMYFTAMVEVLQAWSVPSEATNNRKRQVQFWARIRTGNVAITNAYINLSGLGGPAAGRMTNLSGMTLFRYTFTVASNWPEGRYNVIVTGRDNKNYSGSGTASFGVLGRSLFTTEVVYDGDSVPADPEQWFPVAPPSTGLFQDVDSSVTAPHNGFLSGRFTITNTTTTIFHWKDRSWEGRDVSTADRLEIWMKGLGGGESLGFRLAFISPSNTLVMSRTTNLSAQPDWSQILIPVRSLTNGLGLGAATLQKFIGLALYANTPDETVFLDDVKFGQFMQLTNVQAVPSTMDQAIAQVVTFSCRALTRLGSVVSCTLDLTPVGGNRVRMSNLPPGSEVFRYSYTIPAGSPKGQQIFKIWARDDQGHYVLSRDAKVMIISSSETLFYDYENGYSQRWGDQNPANIDVAIFGNRPLSAPVGTNWHTNFWAGYPNPAKHGIGSDWLNLRTRWSNYDYNRGMSYLSWSQEIIYGRGPPVKDFSAQTGWYGYMYIDPIPGIYGEENYLKSVVMVNSWDWYEGFQVTVYPGLWTKVSMDFAKCMSGLNVPSDIQGLVGGTDFIGWTLNGLYSGIMQTNVFNVYWDWVVGRDGMPPVAPTGLNAVANEPGTLDLSWAPAPEADVEYYKIYQSGMNDISGARFVARAYTNFYKDKGVWSDKTYFYWITACDRSDNEGPASAVASGTPAGSMPCVPYKYKGATLQVGPADSPFGAGLNAVLTNMFAAGVNTVGVPIAWEMANRNANTFASNGTATLSDLDLRYIITNIQRKGMRVFLIPKVQSADGVPIANMRPASIASWLTSYQPMLMKYATIASQHKVALFSVGFELNWTAGGVITNQANQTAADGYAATWNNLINLVHAKIGTNRLTYCSSACPTNAYFTAFWRHLSYRFMKKAVWDNPNIDYIGINANYVLDDLPDNEAPMSRYYWQWDCSDLTNDYDITEVATEIMKNRRLTQRWIYSLEQWKNQYYPSKKIILTEIGYPSEDRAAKKVAKENLAAYAVNTNLQKSLYEAAFRRWWDKPYVDGMFWRGWRPTLLAGNNKFFTPQNKPAFEIVKQWYNPLRPHHFSIAHAGGGDAMKWVPVVIRVHYVDHTMYPSYTGAVTLDINKGTPSAIAWTNLSGCGTLVDWGLGTAKAVFTFTAGCSSVVTLGVKDNTMETVNLKVKNGLLREDAAEDDDLVFSGPLSYFLVVHDGYGVRNYPESVTVQAIDVFGNIKVNYAGTVSLFVVGTPGSVKWRLAPGCTNSTFRSNATRAWFNFRKSDLGVMSFLLKDSTAETIDVEARTASGSQQDNDASDPLRILDFDHFAVVHDGVAAIGYAAPVIIRAENAAGAVVPGISANITIYYATKPNGNPVWQVAGGSGVLSMARTNWWVYGMVASDGGAVTLSVMDDSRDTIDIEATDGLHSDNDQAPRDLVFQSHIYHYVRRNNSTPVAPFVLPSTAATNVIQAVQQASAGDVVLILDSATYPALNLTGVNSAFKKIAGAPTNRPRFWISSAAAAAVDLDDTLANSRRTAFQNLTFVNPIGPVRAMVIGSGASRTLTNAMFYNCAFSNGAGDPEPVGPDGGMEYYYCSFSCPAASYACRLNANGAGHSMLIGGSCDGAMYAAYAMQNGDISGNIVRRLAGASGGLTVYGYNAAIEHAAYFNTTYKNASGGTGGDQQFGATNNIAVSNAGAGNRPGIGTMNNVPAEHAYNMAIGTGGTGGNFGGGAGTGDITANPQFVNAARGDFRLLPTSPALRAGMPNGAVRSAVGAHTWSVFPAVSTLGTVTTYTLTVSLLRTLPKTGAVRLTFSPTANIAGAAFLSSTMNGGWTVSVNANVLTLARNGAGSDIPPYRAQRIVLGGIGNPMVYGSTNSLVCETAENMPFKLEGDWIEWPRLSNCFEITPVDLVLKTVTPPDGATGVAAASPVVLTFGTDVLVSTVTSNTVLLQDSSWRTIRCTYTVVGKTVTVTPSAVLQPNEFHTLTVTLGVQSTLGKSLTVPARSHFTTAPGALTPHEYNTVVLNANLSDWQAANPVLGTNLFEPVVDDSADAVWGHTRQLYLTWNTNNLYVAIRKPVLSGSEWWDYLCIDTTRDTAGPSSGPLGWHPLAFTNNRRPEFILMFDHNNIGPVWDAWTNYRWTGAVWQASVIPVSNHSQDTGSTIEVRLPWSIFGTVPNRVAVAAMVFTNRTFAGPLYDTCPENLRGVTNWITVAPDENGDEIADNIVVVRLDHFLISHDGSGSVGIWEPFEIRAISSLGTVLSNYAGTVTIDIISGTPAQVKFTNLSGGGSLTWLGNAKAVYQWVAGDGGLISLRIRDTGADAVNIRVRTAAGVVDENGEGSIVFNAPADLLMWKTGSPGLVNVGDIITYRVFITNTDAYPSFDVSIRDAIPYGTTYVANSLRHGPAASTYAVATNLTDGLSDDEGSFDGSTVVFCGPQAGLAPSASGMLAANSSWAVYFQVRVRGTNYAPVNTPVIIVNSDPAFDGSSAKNGISVNSGLIMAGDTTAVAGVTNIFQSASDRDHDINISAGSAYACQDNAVFVQVGDDDGTGGSHNDYYGFLTFGLGAIPSAGNISTATLSLRQSAFIGAPDASLHFDAVVYSNIYDTSSDLAGRYNLTGGPRAIVSNDFFSTATYPGNNLWLKIPVTGIVRACLADPVSYLEDGSYRMLQVRMRDGTPGAAQAQNGDHWIQFFAQNSALSNRPRLKISYSANQAEQRGFTGFNLAFVSNDNITAATMFVFRSNVAGTAGDITPIIAESLDFGPSIDSSDYALPAIMGIGSFAAAAGSWVPLAVKSAVSNAWTNAKGWSKDSSSRWLQVRFRPAAVNTNDAQADRQEIGSAESPLRQPRLLVYYLKNTPFGPPATIVNVASVGVIFSTNNLPLLCASCLQVTAVKSITNTTLKGAVSRAVPGSTLSLRIDCTNRTSITALGTAVFDLVDDWTVFVTNSANVPAGWTLEYSTNTLPVQLYVSPSYTAVCPAVSRIKWVRWKIPGLAGFTGARFRYRVTVK